MTHFFYSLVDQNGRAYFTYNAVMLWLGLQVESIGILWSAGALFASYITASLNQSDPSEMALAVTSTFSMLGII